MMLVVFVFNLSDTRARDTAQETTEAEETETARRGPTSPRERNRRSCGRHQLRYHRQKRPAIMATDTNMDTEGT